MKSIRQFVLGYLSAIGTSLLVLGAAALSLMESDVNVIPLPGLATTIPLVTNTIIPGQPTIQPVTPTATWVRFIQCNVPHGWQPYEVKPGDNLDSIAVQFGLSAEKIYSTNCLQSSSLPPGTILYLPAPTPTPTVTLVTFTPTPTLTFVNTPITVPSVCGPPPGWVVYIVRSGDTVFRLSVATGISQGQLMSANCMSSTYLSVGQRLYLPFIPAAPTLSIPTATNMPIPTATTSVPTVATTAVPTIAATTAVPTVAPTTAVPTIAATTAVPTVEPTTAVPTVVPTTAVPTVEPTTAVPTVAPTTDPTIGP